MEKERAISDKVVSMHADIEVEVYPHKIKLCEEKIKYSFEGKIVTEEKVDEFCDEICSEITDSKCYENLDEKGIAHHDYERYTIKGSATLMVKSILINYFNVGEIHFLLQDSNENEDDYRTYMCEEINLVK